MSKKIGTVRGVFTLVGAGGGGAPDLDRHPDQPGDDRRLLGGPGHPRRRRPDDGALTALRRLDEVGRAPHLGPGVPDRLPAGARLLRLGAARRAAVGELVPGAHHRLVGSLSIDGLVDDLRTYLGVLAFGLGLVFGFTFDTAGPSRPRLAPVVYKEREPEAPAETSAEPAAEPAPEPPVDGAGELPLGSGIARSPAEGDTEARDERSRRNAEPARHRAPARALRSLLAPPSAEERLSAELGGDFSQRLVRALAGVSGRAAAAARPLRTA